MYLAKYRRLCAHTAGWRSGCLKAKRRESESITIFFGNGRPSSGERLALTSGTPSRLSEDRRSPLFPGDTAPAANLARSVLQRCA
jgi:hypothetical protein